MENTLLVALSRQAGLRREMNAVAHNIANMNTQGYKREGVMFDDFMMRSKGGERIMGDKIAFTRDLAQYRDLSEGAMEHTGNPLDVAIQGEEGYFVVETPEGNRYTRNGHFQLNSDGLLVNSDGHSVLTPDGEPIEIPQDQGQITITKDGLITTEQGQVAQLSVVRFDNPQFMRKEAGTLYTTDEAPLAVENPAVHQGNLEGSNVNPILEMTRMIEVHRNYDRAKNLIEKEDERIKKANALIDNR